MIEFEEQPLPEGAHDKLKNWLKSPGAGIFKSIVEGQVKKHQAQALAYLMKRTESDDKLSASEIENADKYQHCLNVLEETGSEQSTPVLIKIK